MSKTFTVNVPDQLWVDLWNTNKTESYTYNGPDSWNVLVNISTNEIMNWSTEAIETSSSDEDIIIVDATDTNSIAVAHFFDTIRSDHEYTYETETNHDGSTYENITNPTIQDYFDVVYDEDNGITLAPMYKNPKTIVEEKAESRLAYVEKYNNVYDFDTETQETIDNFIASINTYMESMSNVYPWKYVTIDENNIPKIPASLVSVFNTLPEVN